MSFEKDVHKLIGWLPSKQCVPMPSGNASQFVTVFLRGPISPAVDFTKLFLT